jgi:hypothetical protein
MEFPSRLQTSGASIVHQSDGSPSAYLCVCFLRIMVFFSAFRQRVGNIVQIRRESQELFFGEKGILWWAAISPGIYPGDWSGEHRVRCSRTGSTRAPWLKPRVDEDAFSLIPGFIPGMGQANTEFVVRERVPPAPPG